jgi:hypothetical protein
MEFMSEFSEIIDFAISYHGSREKEAIRIYNRERPAAVAKARLALSSSSDDRNAQLYDACDLLRATEGIAYGFYKVHGRHIGGAPPGAAEFSSRYKPRWARGRAMQFEIGNSTSTDELPLSITLEFVIGWKFTPRSEKNSQNLSSGCAKMRKSLKAIQGLAGEIVIAHREPNQRYLALTRRTANAVFSRGILHWCSG